MKNILVCFKNKYIITGLVFILISICSLYYFHNKKSNITSEPDINSLVIESRESMPEKISIDIKGFVKSEGVYKLDMGSRVIDAIKASGGLKKGANTRFINLSKVLNDGDVIVIYSEKEINDAKKSNTIYVETPCVCEEVKNDGCFKEENDNTLININTSSLEELMTLDGIGESKAKSIIIYRKENENFKSIEEIMNVSGISETIFAKIKNIITV